MHNMVIGVDNRIYNGDVDLAKFTQPSRGSGLTAGQNIATYIGANPI